MTLQRIRKRLAWIAGQVSEIPGRLGLHQEFGALLAWRLLETGGSADGSAD